LKNIPCESTKSEVKEGMDNETADGKRE